MEFEDTGMAWPEVLVYFCDFLRGCGYVLPPGDVTFEEIE
jgi:hypothetical protein